MGRFAGYLGYSLEELVEADLAVLINIELHEAQPQLFLCEFGIDLQEQLGEFVHAEGFVAISVVGTVDSQHVQLVLIDFLA